MNLLSYLSNLFAVNDCDSVGSLPPTKVHVNMPLVAPPKDRTPEPSCLARGIAKAWIEDRGAWTIVREPSDATDVWFVKLIHPSLGIVISFHESALFLRVFKAQINGEVKIFDAYYHYDPVNSKQANLDREYLEPIIRLNGYPELKERMDAAAREDAARTQNIKAIEALGCSAQKDQA